MDMGSNVVKFPFNVSRRAHARKPRTSRNGTPEERAEEHLERKKQPGHDWKPSHKGNNPLRAHVPAMLLAVTGVGMISHRRHGFDPSTLDDRARKEWLEDLRKGAMSARLIASECDKAISRLGGQPNHPTALDMVQSLRIAITVSLAQGKSVDQIFDELEESAERGARS
jgi:hypothetical protein